ncbi:hypothetical protein BDP27DRAFT_197057 [Rhodocollybia butyracea]|uniref:CNH domain-containing protein n=1 Tax=Rhodocollybia butyracea TaxID=206335 RepID=A0A9P5Q6J3_9AGAR|nr:hypothetical protein BDP27DRAFT_197057 [Rhodocollybia butyracea]
MKVVEFDHHDSVYARFDFPATSVEGFPNDLELDLDIVHQQIDENEDDVFTESDSDFYDTGYDPAMSVEGFPNDLELDLEDDVFTESDSDHDLGENEDDVVDWSDTDNDLGENEDSWSDSDNDLDEQDRSRLAELKNALELERVEQESLQVFKVEVLNRDISLTPAGVDESESGGDGSTSKGGFTGRVCSILINKAPRRALVAVGCTEGVWIGFRDDPKSMRQVLDLKFVTQCAILEDYGIFLVLADKSLFAYHIETLVESLSLLTAPSQQPQKLNGNKDVDFFAVGTLFGRPLVIYICARKG